MKNNFKLSSIIIVCFTFGLGFFTHRVITVINNTDLADYFQGYGENALYFNKVLDDAQVKPFPVRENINRVLFSRLLCSPMIHYLPRAIEQSDGSLDDFWKGYYNVIKYSNFDDEKEFIKKVIVLDGKAVEFISEKEAKIVLDGLCLNNGLRGPV